MNLPQLYWTDDEDPKNPGWCFRDREGIGYPLDWEDRDDVEGAIEEARLHLLPEEDRVIITVVGASDAWSQFEVDLWDEDDVQAAIFTQGELT